MWTLSAGLALAAAAVLSLPWSSATRAETYGFPTQLWLPHDDVVPYQPELQIDVLYPILIELMPAAQEAVKLILVPDLMQTTAH